jgi:hypothetical protein
MYFVDILLPDPLLPSPIYTTHTPVGRSRRERFLFFGSLFYDHDLPYHLFYFNTFLSVTFSLSYLLSNHCFCSPGLSFRIPQPTQFSGHRNLVCHTPSTVPYHLNLSYPLKSVFHPLTCIVLQNRIKHLSKSWTIRYGTVY